MDRVPRQTRAPDSVRLLLTFRLDDLRFAVDAERIVVIERAVAIQPLPTAPPVIEGVVLYRGDLVPVHDLRARFSLPPRPLALDQHLVVARAAGRQVAFRVDVADGLVRLPLEQLTDAREIAPGLRHIQGVAADGGEILVLHDPERFLDAAEAMVLQAALERLRQQGDP